MRETVSMTRFGGLIQPYWVLHSISRLSSVPQPAQLCSELKAPSRNLDVVAPAMWGRTRSTMRTRVRSARSASSMTSTTQHIIGASAAPPRYL